RRARNFSPSRIGDRWAEPETSHVTKPKTWRAAEHTLHADDQVMARRLFRFGRAGSEAERSRGAVAVARVGGVAMHGVSLVQGGDANGFWRRPAKCGGDVGR